MLQWNQLNVVQSRNMITCPHKRMTEVKGELSIPEARLLPVNVTLQGVAWVAMLGMVCVSLLYVHVSLCPVPHQTVIVSLIFSLGPTDGQGDCVPELEPENLSEITMNDYNRDKAWLMLVPVYQIITGKTLSGEVIMVVCVRVIDTKSGCVTS